MRALTLDKMRDFEWVFCADSFSVMNRELVNILRTQQGIQRVETFLSCLWEHVSTAAAVYFECEREELPSGVVDMAFAHATQVLTYYVMGFVEDVHREHMVRCHAQNMPTTYAVYDLIETYREIARLAEDDGLGEERLVSLLVHRLAYLKPTSNRWPGTKYSDVWFAARQAYRETQRTLDLPYTSMEEQIQVLSREAEQIVERLETDAYTEKEHQTLVDTLQKIFDRLNTTEKSRAAARLPGSELQLIAVLERLVALTSTEGVSDAVVEKIKALAPPATDLATHQKDPDRTET